MTDPDGPAECDYGRVEATRDVATLVALFVVACIPRLVGIDRFLALDEYLWVDRSRNFLLALIARDWPATFQTGHPGVTTMWSGALGLVLYGWQHGLLADERFVSFLHALNWQNQPVALVAAMRGASLLATAAAIPALYWLLRRLVGIWPAVAAALLVALDPWLLGHGRILHHDALAALAMAVAVVALLNYLLVEPTAGMLLFSGVATGVAALTKISALYVGLWAGLAFVVAFQQRRLTPGVAIRAALAWAIAILATILVCWPALWLEPWSALVKVGQLVATYTENPHETGQVWFGRVVEDPGPAFYPVAIAYVATPLLAIGLAACAVLIWRRSEWRAASPVALRATAVLLLVAYAALYLVVMSVGAKKHIRYVLPALVAFNLVAGIGIGFALDWWQSRRGRPSARPLSLGAGAGLLIVLWATAAPHFPYYFTYYNPLLGGHGAAARTLLLGSGEGLELAAAYLDRQPAAASLRVVASMPNVFAPFFQGQTQPWQPDLAPFAANRLVIYRRQAQLGIPDPALLAYITTNWPLLHTVEVEGVPYAWIYEAPAADWVIGLELGDEIDSFQAQAPPGLLAYKRTRSGDGERLILYRMDDGSPPWQVQTRTPGRPWRTAPLSARSSSTQPGAIIQEEFDLSRVDGDGAAHWSVRIGIPSAGQRDEQWWGLPTSPSQISSFQ